MEFIPTNASMPPKIGEYGYYDSRINDSHLNNSSNKISHYLVATSENPNITLGCYYSLKDKNEEQYKTCHGIIVKIKKTL